MMQDELLIVGAGGHAKVVLSTALDEGQMIHGFLDDNAVLFNKKLGDYPILGSSELLFSDAFKDKLAVLALGNNALREQFAKRFLKTKWKTLIHPNAYVHPSVELGEGTVVFAGCVIQPDVKIGKHCIINTGTTIDHDCVLEDYVHLAPGVHLAGKVTIGRQTFLGIGSVVIPGITLASHVTVAAGAVVIDHIATKKRVMGIPAKEKV